MLRRILYTGTVFLGSLLVFLIQPIAGKAMLPRFGGGAGVWTTAMLFFQAALLLGYAYAHWSQRFRPRVRTTVHLLLLAAACLTIPIRLAPDWNPAPGADPAPGILAMLAVTLGLPYLLLASTGPMVQAWWSLWPGSTSPYRLFAISNVASFAALALYPVMMEPLLTTRNQLLLWSVCFAAFVLLSSAAAIAGGPSKAPERLTGVAPIRERLLWAGLAACPSVLWLGMASVLSQSIAPVPLLWILPLAVYLLSFILCFEGDGWYRPSVYRALLPVSWIVICYGLVRQGQDVSLKGIVLLFAGALFVCCMFCHGELASRKPPAAHLTSFYLWLAAGGAMGGLFVGLIAPHVFDRFLELPIAVAACFLLGMRLLYRYPIRQVARLLLVAIAAFLFAARMNDNGLQIRLRIRNFYGSLQVSDAGTGAAAVRVLSSGSIHHGAQFMAPGKSRTPITYYGAASGVARAIGTMRDRTLRTAIIGLGAGTLAAYARERDTFRFYEINPAVIGIAHTEFRYLSESAGKVEVVAGDGRLSMQREIEDPFDLIVLDAFSGDSIPTHLLTREAFALYFSRLKREGIIAVHITNKYVDLAPVVRALAEDAGRVVELVHSAADPGLAVFDATWMLVKNGQVEGALRGAHVWTDDYTNLFRVLR
jgi:hypothetical protein